MVQLHNVTEQNVQVINVNVRNKLGPKCSLVLNLTVTECNSAQNINATGYKHCQISELEDDLCHKTCTSCSLHVS